MDEIFRALDDPGRRLLLDRLFQEDGQSLAELCEYLPEMTRFGVMNHLRVLEEASLVTTRKVGRRKLHYLNPVPVRLVHDRWISKFTEPAINSLTAMKAHLEGTLPVETPVPSHIYQTYIRCEPEAAWEAIVDGNVTVKYFYGQRVESTWEVGAPIRYVDLTGAVVADGTIVAIDAPNRVEMTFHPRWDPGLEAEGPARTAWIVGRVGDLTTVTVEYYELPTDSAQAADFMAGIPYIVAGMKTLLETGSPIDGD
ncbi:MAG: helix-turn-helix domain-containing protein [bacterium]|nr:helix-turn-helix domain-containing protein [bacterium]